MCVVLLGRDLPFFVSFQSLVFAQTAFPELIAQLKLFVFLMFICLCVCQQTNTKDIAGQSASFPLDRYGKSTRGMARVSYMKCKEKNNILLTNAEI